MTAQSLSPSELVDLLLQQRVIMKYIISSRIYSLGVMQRAGQLHTMLTEAIYYLSEGAAKEDLYWDLERIDAAMRQLTACCLTNTCPPEGIVAERTSPREPVPRPWPLLPDWYPRPQWD